MVRRRRVDRNTGGDMKRRMFIASVCAISVAPKGTKAFNGNGEYYGRSQMTEILPQLRMENSLYREYYIECGGFPPKKMWWKGIKYELR